MCVSVGDCATITCTWRQLTLHAKHPICRGRRWSWRMADANMIECSQQITDYYIEIVKKKMFLCSPVYQDSGAWLLCWFCCERFYLHWHHTQWASLLSCRQPEHLQIAQGSQHHFGRLMFLYITMKPLEVLVYILARDYVHLCLF